jgi:organic hydroperoxide reductase OsmC/OhrA
MDTEGEFPIELVQQENYRFEVRFDRPGIPPLITDEGSPLGGDAGPSPSQLLGTAVANCLAASLLFALRKYRNEPSSLAASVRVRLGRNEHQRLRISGIGVDLKLGMEGAAIQQRERILAQFEDFCVVTQSVRAAIPVQVRVFDRAGAVLHGAA